MDKFVIEQLHNDLSKLTLLLVDDEPDVLESMKLLLSAFFGEIVTAVDGADALKKFHENFIDFVISDITMPNMSGFELVKQIKSESIYTPIILISGHSEPNILSQAITSGVDNYIFKPINLDTISTALVSTIEKAKLRQEIYLDEIIIDQHVLRTKSDLDGNITYVSSALLNATGYENEDLIGKSHSVFSHNTNQNHTIQKMWDTIKQDEVFYGELENVKKNGDTFWVKLIIEPLYSFNGEKIGYSSIREDITEHKKVELLSITDPLTELYNRRYFNIIFHQELKKAQENNQNITFIMIDIDYFKQFNDTYGHQCGDEALVEVAKILQSFTAKANDFVFRLGGEEFAIISIDMDEEKVFEYLTSLNRAIENLKIAHSKNSVSDFLTTSIGAVVSNDKDATIDKLINIADKNLYKAKNSGRNAIELTTSTHSNDDFEVIDPITKLPDRKELIKLLNKYNNQEVLMAIISLNSLNNYVDRYSKEIIDEILVEKTKAYRRIVRDDGVKLFKINFTEFALLVTEPKLFEKYKSLIEYSILNDDKTLIEKNDEILNIYVTQTVGVAIDRTDLFTKAGSALKKAQSSQNRFYLINEESLDKKDDFVNFEKLKKYKHALENNMIIPYFQPIVDARTGEIVKYEALARIEDEDGEIISPFMFLDSAKEDKTFEFFTRQMLQKVFNIYSKNNVEIAVNLTYENIINPDLVNYIKNRLDKFGGERITFEIVESEDIEDYKVLESFIVEMKKYGCQIAIDDFGSGYSNFTYLIKLNTDFLKLDGSLIEDINTDMNVELIVRSLIAFAKETGIKTIAEFVSTKEIAEKTLEMGVDLCQGYYYGKPKSAAEYNLNI